MISSSGLCGLCLAILCPDAYLITRSLPAALWWISGHWRENVTLFVYPTPTLNTLPLLSNPNSSTSCTHGFYSFVCVCVCVCVCACVRADQTSNTSERGSLSATTDIIVSVSVLDSKAIKHEEKSFVLSNKLETWAIQSFHANKSHLVSVGKQWICRYIFLLHRRWQNIRWFSVFRIHNRNDFLKFKVNK